MNYGFNPDKVIINEEDYIFGASLPREVISQDGTWNIPVYEPQAKKYETWGCTVWGGQNQIEMYMKKVFGFEPNYDERFNYILAGVDVGGTNPQDAYESFRKDGLIDDQPQPDTFDEFKDKSYITVDKRVKGQHWLNKYVIKHEWIKKPTMDDIINALPYSPIALGVTAWHEKDGVYVDRGERNNHWCVAFAPTTYKGRKTVKIFDSYDQSVKTLHPDHAISIAKRIYLTVNTGKKNWLLDILKRLFMV